MITWSRLCLFKGDLKFSLGRRLFSKNTKNDKVLIVRQGQGSKDKESVELELPLHRLRLFPRQPSQSTEATGLSMQGLMRRIVGVFLLAGYPSSVRPEYAAFSGWALVNGIAGSFMGGKHKEYIHNVIIYIHSIIIV